MTESGVLGWELWSGMRQGEGKGCKERFEGLEGRGEGIRRMKERRGEEREGNRENNEKKEKERVRGTVMAMVKGGQREGEYDDVVRRMGHKKLVERLEAARLETKWEKSTPGAAKQEEQELVGRRKRRGKYTDWGKWR